MSERIVVALSGGVDSAVAALLLRRAGHEVQGLHMTNWEDDEAGYCTAAADWQSARSVATELGIVLHRVSFTAEYREQVFKHFLADYAAGLTPNPDILCNREVKFGVCLEYAQRLGGQQLATGHYARIVQDSDGSARLYRARDTNKDQSYFLQAMPSAALRLAAFPLGDTLKDEVREHARRAGLPVHDRPDSTGICFIGERPFREFLQHYLQGARGPIETRSGEVLGYHDGLMYHTIGQRQGLKIGGLRHGSNAPWYVAAKDVTRNALIVVQGQDHPALFTQSFSTAIPVWLQRHETRFAECHVQVRHRQHAVACTVQMAAGGAEVSLCAPLRGVAPGQYAAFYAGDECLGGAPIVDVARLS